MTAWVLVMVMLGAEGGTQCGNRPAERLDCAQDAFQYGRYDEVVRLLRGPIEKGAFVLKADHVEALRIYGIGLFLTKRRAAARLVFERLAKLDPSLHLDPRLVPPEVVRAFKRIRARVIAKRLASVKKEPKPLWLWNLIPPGGQIQNKQYLKAWLVGSSELVLFGLNLASYLILNSNRYRKDGSYVVQDPEGNILEDHRTLAKAMLVVNYVSFGLLVGTVIYGVVDGWVVMQRLVSERRKTRRLLLRQLQASGPGSGALFRFTF